MRGDGNKIAVGEAHEDIAIAEPLIGGNVAILLLERKFYRVIRITDIQEY